MPSPKLQNTKRVNRLNNQTKTPNGVKTFTFYRLGTATSLFSMGYIDIFDNSWDILITDSHDVNEKGACLKISFTSILKT